MKIIDSDVKAIHLLFPSKHLLLTPSSIHISLTLSIHFWLRLLMTVQKLRVIRGLLATGVGPVGRGGIPSVPSFTVPAFMVLTLTVLTSTVPEFHVTDSQNTKTLGVKRMPTLPPILVLPSMFPAPTPGPTHPRHIMKIRRMSLRQQSLDHSRT